ncbi:MAG: hypothetical protein ABWY08_16170 [Comamonas sp.]
MLETRTYDVAAASAMTGNGFVIVDELAAKAISADTPVRRLDPTINVKAVAVHINSAHASLGFKGFLRHLKNQFS